MSNTKPDRARRLSTARKHGAKSDHKPGQKPGQKLGQKPSQKPGHKLGIKTRPPRRIGSRSGPRPGKDSDSARQTDEQFERRPVRTDEWPMRIAKAIARAGLCSRREAERWIAEARVKVNGTTLKTPAFEVSQTDKIVVDGEVLPAAEPIRLWRYHKPKGLVTTHADPQGRKTVFESLPPELPRVISIGRLDFNTEGLLLLTNDGALARHLELPATGWLRRYKVRAKGRVQQADLDKLKDGTEIEGVRYGPIDATVEQVQGANTWLNVAIREGKNREVRKIMTSLGLEVNRLIRTSYGPFQLLELQAGGIEVVKRRALAEHLGVETARAFGLSEGPDERKARHERGRHRSKTEDGGDDA